MQIKSLNLYHINVSDSACFLEQALNDALPNDETISWARFLSPTLAHKFMCHAMTKYADSRPVIHHSNTRKIINCKSNEDELQMSALCGGHSTREREYTVLSPPVVEYHPYYVNIYVTITFGVRYAYKRKTEKTIIVDGEEYTKYTVDNKLSYTPWFESKPIKYTFHIESESVTLVSDKEIHIEKPIEDEDD